MDYINLVAYVQQEIVNILCDVQAWGQAYIDNIICGARSLFHLFHKLQVFFEVFLCYNIFIKPLKLYLNYPDMELFWQKVNFLGLITSDKKLKVIRFLIYPNML